MQQILTVKRHKAPVEQTCTGRLSSWEQMNDGGWMAWKWHDLRKGKDRERQEEETSDWTEGGGKDGKSIIYIADKDAEKQRGLGHSGLKSALVKDC